jgi:CBS domain-containing protein
MIETIRSILKNKGSAVWSLAPEATIHDALVMLADKDVGALPVMSGGMLVGMFSERDYARKVSLLGKTSRDTTVREIMTSPVITVTPDHTIEECMRVVTHHHIRHLPVVEGDDLIGIVSIGDLVNAIISNQAATIGHLNNYISGKYPA